MNVTNDDIVFFHLGGGEKMNISFDHWVGFNVKQHANIIAAMAMFPMMFTKNEAVSLIEAKHFVKIANLLGLGDMSGVSVYLAPHYDTKQHDSLIEAIKKEDLLQFLLRLEIENDAYWLDVVK